MIKSHISPSVKQLLPAEILPYLTDRTEEIRFRMNQEIILTESETEIVTGKRADKQLLETLIDRMTKSSLYTCFDSLKEGFLTLEGGHRAGISGTAVYQNGSLSYVKDISSVNLRLAHEIKGCATPLMSQLTKNSGFPGTLIISKPGIGKTTLLRDLIRQLSETVSGIKIALIDERSEIAAVHLGEAQNDLGKRCDVLNGYQKADGIRHAVRALSPTLVAVDEISSEDDVKSLIDAHGAGITVLASFHGDFSLSPPPVCKQLIQHGVIQKLVFLSPHSYSNRIHNVINAEEWK